MGGAKKNNKKRAFAGYILPKLKVDACRSMIDIFIHHPILGKFFNPFSPAMGTLSYPLLVMQGGFFLPLILGDTRMEVHNKVKPREFHHLTIMRHVFC